MILLFLFSALFISNDNLHNSCEFIYDATLNAHIYTKTDIAPQFPDSELDFLFFFRKKFIYPAEQQEIQTSFTVSFVVDADGKILNPRIKNKQESELTLADKEALRVIALMPAWKPCQCEGTPVPCYWSETIRISLNSHR